MDRRFVTAAGAWLTQFTIIGLMFTFGLFFPIFETEFGWSRTVLSAGVALSFFMMGVLAMLGGPLADRFGPRVVLSVTGTAYAVGYLLIGQIAEAWQLWLLFGTLIALGMGTHDVVTLSTIARLFSGRRGLMTALVKVGTACGQFALPPIAAWLILTVGWRDMTMVLGIAAGGVLLLAALMMQAPSRPAGGISPEVAGVPFAEARRSSTLWRICAIQFLFFPTLMTIPVHIVAHGTDLGMELSTAAWLLSVMATASVAGRLGVGAFIDQIGGRRAYVICFVPLIVSLVVLLFTANQTILFATIAVYGFAHGGFFTVVSPTVAEFFGLRAHGAIFGVVLFCGTIGGSIGPILTGRVFDLTSSYDPAFAMLAIMALIGLGLALSLPDPKA
jgi:MFS family permease